MQCLPIVSAQLTAVLPRRFRSSPLRGRGAGRLGLAPIYRREFTGTGADRCVFQSRVLAGAAVERRGNGGQVV